MKNPEEFYKFYREKMNSLKYEPNVTHYKLVELEKRGKLRAVVTQNIDGLHQKAGSEKVFELHGSVLRNYCIKCNKFYSADKVFYSKETIPICECGGIIKPDVVLYEEGLDENVMYGAIKKIAESDLLIIGGTSLTVYPASGLINYFKGRNLVLINKDATSLDNMADIVINKPLGEVFKYID